jgi:dTDP-glucose 4,6-dehydratase
MPGEIYNVGGGTEMTNLELTKRILKMMELPESKITYVKDRQGHDRRYSVNYNKIKLLGYLPITNFNDKLEFTLNWYTRARTLESN